MPARIAFADPASATRRLILIFAASLLLFGTVFCLVVSLSTRLTYPVQNPQQTRPIKSNMEYRATCIHTGVQASASVRESADAAHSAG